MAGVDLKEWFRKNISSPEELDYAESLDWFGLRFAPPAVEDPEKKDKPAKKWQLEIREDSSEPQKAHLKKLLAPGRNLGNGRGTTSRNSCVARAKRSVPWPQHDFSLGLVPWEDSFNLAPISDDRRIEWNSLENEVAPFRSVAGRSTPRR